MMTNQNETDDIKEATILFADVMGSSELANNLSLNQYCDQIIAPFQEIAHDVVEKCLGKEVGHNSVSVAGEELCVILFSERLSLAEKLLRAIQIARELKMRWLLTPFNQQRIKVGKRPHEIGVGINVGDTKLVYSKHTGRKEPEGYAINLAKRVEDASRDHGKYTKIMLSRRAHQEATKHEFKLSWGSVINVSFKGISQLDFIYEIRYFYGFVYWKLIEELQRDIAEGKNRFVQVFNVDYSNFWMGIELASCLLYQMKYHDAIDVLKKLLLVHEDSGDILVLLGECYEQLGLKAYADSDESACRLFFERAEDAFKRSIALSSQSEDMYVELGLLYYNWFRLIDHDEEKWHQAYELFSNGTKLGVIHTRSAFWKWRLGLEKDRVDMASVLLDLGWVDRKMEKQDQVAIVGEAIEKYLALIGLSNFKANVYQAVASVYGGQFKRYDEALTYCDSAIAEAELVLPEEGIYTNLGDYSGIVGREVFIGHCKQLKKRFSGQK